MWRGLVTAVAHPSRRAGQSQWWSVAAVLGWCALVVGVLALFARRSASSSQLVILAATFSHFLLAAIPVAVVLFAVAQRWRSLVVGLVVFTFAVGTQADLFITDDLPSAGVPLTVLQANVHQGAADPATIITAVRDSHVDVAMFEEINADPYAALQSAGLGDLLPYVYAPNSGGAQIGIWSRYPLTDEHSYLDAGVEAISARLALPGRAVTVMAAHPPAPYPAEPTPWLQQVRALRGILASLRAGGEMVVVGGDFNGTVDNAQFRALLSTGYADGAEQSGAGYLATFPVGRAYPPFAAIDHVLTADGAHTVSLRRVNLHGSDHRGLLAQVRLTGGVP